MSNRGLAFPWKGIRLLLMCIFAALASLSRGDEIQHKLVLLLVMVASVAVAWWTISQSRTLRQRRESDKRTILSRLKRTTKQSTAAVAASPSVSVHATASLRISLEARGNNTTSGSVGTLGVSVHDEVQTTDHVEVSDFVAAKVLTDTSKQRESKGQYVDSGWLDTLGKHVADQRDAMALWLAAAGLLLFAVHATALAVVIGVVALLSALDAVAVRKRTRAQVYGSTPLELLELVEWIDEGGRPPGGGSRLYGPLIEQAATEVGIDIRAGAPAQ